MYFHNSLIPRGTYFLLPLESKQEATTVWNFTKCISEVKVNQLKVKNMHVKMGISTFKGAELKIEVCSEKKKERKKERKIDKEKNRTTNKIRLLSLSAQIT